MSQPWGLCHKTATACNGILIFCTATNVKVSVYTSGADGLFTAVSAEPGSIILPVVDMVTVHEEVQLKSGYQTLSLPYLDEPREVLVWFHAGYFTQTAAYGDLGMVLCTPILDVARPQLVLDLAETTYPILYTQVGMDMPDIFTTNGYPYIKGFSNTSLFDRAIMISFDPFARLANTLHITFAEGLTTSRSMYLSIYTTHAMFVKTDYSVHANWYKLLATHGPLLHFHARHLITSGTMNIPLDLLSDRSLWNAPAVFLVFSPGVLTVEGDGAMIEHMQLGLCAQLGLSNQGLFTTAVSALAIPSATSSLSLAIQGEETSALRWFVSFDRFAHLYGLSNSGTAATFSPISNWSIDEHMSVALTTAELISAFQNWRPGRILYNTGTIDFVVVFPTQHELRVGISEVQLISYGGATYRSLSPGTEYISHRMATLVDDAGKGIYTIQKLTSGTSKWRVISI